MTRHTDKPYTVLCVAPYISGFYLGEVISLIKKAAKQHNVNLLTLRTSSFDSYTSPIALNHIDGVISVLSAIESDLVKNILKRGIPIVSHGCDYFPLNVDSVMCDNDQGIELAFKHLVDQGHEKIGFVGDISILDFRRRYESYIKCHRRFELEFDIQRVFNVGDPGYHGGWEAAGYYLDRNKNCTAIIFGSDLLAVSFVERVGDFGVRVPEDLAVVGFDAISVGCQKQPLLTSVDQNLEAFVGVSFNRLMERMKGDAFSPIPIILPCKLRILESCGAPPELQSPINPRGTNDESLRSGENLGVRSMNNYESAKIVAINHYDSVMSLSMLYKPYMNFGYLAQWDQNSDVPRLKIEKIYTQQHLYGITPAVEEVYCEVEDFPPLSLPVEQLHAPKHHIITMVPISIDGQEWGMLAMVGSLRDDEGYSSYAMFTNFMDMLAFGIERQLLQMATETQGKNAQNLSNHLQAVSNTSSEGMWDWDLKSDVLEWNDRALNMFGVNTELNIYAQNEKAGCLERNVPFFDRIHEKDKERIRNQLSSHLHHELPFRAKFRVLKNEEKVIWVEASGEALRHPDGKPFRFIGSFSDITEKNRSEKRIQYMAYHDALTGLPNRSMINERLNRYIASNNPKPLAVMLLDLDRFKLINESYGHQVGDRLLKFVAEQFKQVVRQDDFFARFGGDEFVFLSEVNHQDEALVFAERILKSIQKPFEDDSLEVDISISGSIGVSVYPFHGRTSDDLLKTADISMYIAKEHKKGSAVLYTEDMNSNMVKRTNMESSLRHAISNNELFLLFQPQIDTESGQLIGVEALVRWQSSLYGLVSPLEFIPLAEENGQIQQIGEWVLMSAIDYMAKWEGMGLQPIKMSVNVSANQLMYSDLDKIISACFEKHGPLQSKLTIEITESAAIADVDYTRNILDGLIELGVEISLDDFGTGYSSLSLLKELPLHWVKVDRTFIKEIANSPQDMDFVSSINQMSHSFGYKIVAEGVETPDQLAVAKRIGCDVIQGYVYSKPITEKELIDRYLSRSKGKRA